MIIFNFFKNIFIHRVLIYELSKREFIGKYQGSFLGILWSVFQPILMLSIYSIVFVLILKSRWGFSGTPQDYVLLLFIGLIIHKMIADILLEGPFLIVKNANYIKKVVFPTEVLPLVNVFVCLFQSIISLIIWFGAYYYLNGNIAENTLYLIFILICFLPLLLGIALLVSSLGVYLRDISQLTSILSHALLFLTPIFYSIEAAPALLQNVLYFNPLTFIVEQTRMLIFFDLEPAMNGIFNYFILSSLFLIICIIIFKRLQYNFSDYV